jgi:hypothetical protein
MVPGGVFDYLAVSTESIVVSQIDGVKQSINVERYSDVLYAVPNGSSLDIHFRDGVVFRGISNFEDFADRYHAQQGRSIKLMYVTSNGLQGVPETGEN